MFSMNILICKYLVFGVIGGPGVVVTETLPWHHRCQTHKEEDSLQDPHHVKYKISPANFNPLWTL